MHEGRVVLTVWSAVIVSYMVVCHSVETFLETIYQKVHIVHTFLYVTAHEG